ncbi:MAG: PliI family lysozyme inhibitor of I-type lysozyme [Opitutaceae bacterium]
MKYLFAWISLCLAPFASAATDRVVTRLRLEPDVTVVVAEGDFEPKSIGSFSVRAYRADSAAVGQELDTDDFIGGLICERDGVVEAVTATDIDGDGRAEVVVKIRSAGSGGYLSAVALAVRGRAVEVRARVADLDATADVVKALREVARGGRS